MADYLLIDGYLELLRSHLRFRSDVDDLIAEAADHLCSTHDRLVFRGTETLEAERIALGLFGQPDLVARAMSGSPSGGLAVPSDSTIQAGSLAIWGGVLWLFAVVAWWPAGAIAPWGELDRNFTAILWIVGWCALMGALVLTFNTVGALHTRHGGLGRIGTMGMILTGLAVIAGMPAWVFLGWGFALALGLGLVGVAAFRRGIAPRMPVVTLGAGVATGGAVWVICSRSTGWFPRYTGIWGETWTINLAAVTVAAVVVAVGLFGVGAWLRGEEPAGFDLTGSLATTIGRAEST